VVHLAVIIIIITVNNNNGERRERERQKRSCWCVSEFIFSERGFSADLVYGLSA
jgi:hypothetical protein